MGDETFRLPGWLLTHLAVIAAASRTELGPLIVRELKMRVVGLVDVTDDIKPTLHFVGFEGDEYWSAVKVWGKPHIVHPSYDERMRRDVHPIDTVILAKGDDTQKTARFNADDYKESES